MVKYDGNGGGGVWWSRGTSGCRWGRSITEAKPMIIVTAGVMLVGEEKLMVMLTASIMLVPDEMKRGRDEEPVATVTSSIVQLYLMQ